MEGVVLLTHIVPGGSGLGPPGKSGRRLWGEPLALGVTQVLLGALQVALGGTLLVALRDLLGAHLGVPLGTGTLLMVSGVVLVAMAQRPSVKLARAGLVLGVLGAIFSFLELVLQGVLLPYGCPTCHRVGPPMQGVVLGTQLLLMTSSAAGAALTVTGAVAAARGAGRGQPPVVVYQTALPSAGAGLSEAPLPTPAPQ